MKINIIAISWGNPNRCPVQKNFPFVKVAVPKSEAQQYVDNGNEVITFPDKMRGNEATVRNYLLDSYMKKNDCNALIFTISDLSYMGMWDKYAKRKLTPGELEEFVERHTIMAQDAGVGLWGINSTGHKGNYKEHTPFSFTQPLTGAFHAHMKGSGLRYDDRMPLQMGADMSLQALQKYRAVMRVNFAFMETPKTKRHPVDHTQHSPAMEQEQFAILQAKWGSETVTLSPKRTKVVDYTPIINSPIKGV